MKLLVLFIVLLFCAPWASAQEEVPSFTFEIWVNTCATILYDQFDNIIDVSPAATARNDKLLPKIKKGEALELIINPAWNPTKNIRQLYFKKHKRWLPDHISPGEKDNGLGRIAITLSHDVISGKTLKIHDTNEPASIGKRSSSGCIRKKYEDILRIASILYATEKELPINEAREKLEAMLKSKKTISIRFERIRVFVIFKAS